MTSEEKKTENETVKTTETPVDATPVNPPRETVGEMLRRVRLEKQLDIRDVATYLCIRAQFLEDIENGDIRDLPGDTYASGFIRSYASYLGLDANEIDMRFRSEQTAVRDADRMASTVEPELETFSPDGKIIFAALVLLGVFYAGWKVYTATVQEDIPVAEEQAFEPQNPYPVDNIITTNDVYVEPVKTTTPAVPAKEAESVKATVPVAATPASVETPAPEPVVEKKAEAISGEQPDTPVLVSEDAPLVLATEQPVVEKVRQPRFFGAKNVDSRILLTATEETWIQVFRENDDGIEVVMSRLLYENDKYRLPNEENLFLRTGNAGGLKVFVDGREIPAFGPRGATRSRIAMKADDLLETIEE